MVLEQLDSLIFKNETNQPNNLDLYLIHKS